MDFKFKKKEGNKMNLLWDLDGTIFDTYPLMVESFIQIYEEVHGESVDGEVILPWLKTTTKEAFAHFSIPESFEAKYKEVNRVMAKEGSNVFSGVEEILAAANINVIVTHRKHDSTKELLEKWGIFKYFTEIVSPDEDNFARKPDPGAYKYLYDKYNLEWAIGDRALDLIPAKTVGMKTAAFQNDAIEADVHLNTYTKEVLDIFKK